MKRYLYIILCGLSLIFLAACVKNKETGEQSKMRGVLYTSIVKETGTINLLPGKSKDVAVNVSIFQSNVSDVTLKMTLKVDAEGLDAYNQTHSEPARLLPSSAYAFTSNSLMLARYNLSSTSAWISITASGLEDDQLYVLPVDIDKVDGTDNWGLADNHIAYIEVRQVNQGPEGGDGSMEYPYELSTPADLKAMKEKLSAKEKVFFRLTQDIDMAEIDDWEPLNYASPYEYEIDFDGAGHTINNFHLTDFGSYPSFFGVLYGYCHDVTFTNAVIECGADTGCGILGGYGGTGDKHADVARVHVHGRVTFNGNKTGIGGMFGCAGNATIEASSADVDVYSKKNYVGGLFGYSKKVQVRNCWTAGSIYGDQRVGGIAGGINGVGDEIVNCYSVSKIYIIDDDGNKVSGCTRSLGGIVGHANLDKATNDLENANHPSKSQPNNIVSGCIAWEEELITRSYIGEPDFSVHQYYSSGAIVSYGATHNTYEKCYRRADLNFRDYTDAFPLYDQADSSPASPLVIQNVEGAQYNFPYHGKAAPVGATLTQVAQSIGWSTAIWNFSGDIPTIRPDAQAGPIPDVTNEGELPGFDENDIN